MNFQKYLCGLTGLGLFGCVLGAGSETQADEKVKEQLSKALTHHVSFDQSLKADFTIDRADAFQRAKEPGPAFEPNEEVKIDDKSGKFGGALHFVKKSKWMPAYKGDKIVGFNDKDWSTTVSLWLKLNPDEDLEPGYCDPIQIVGDDTKNGFIFLEWSKDHSPRYFRFAARPRIDIWDPQNLGWEQIPDDKRPMVQLKKASFSRDKWTHAVFVIEHFNTDETRSKGTLYLDGEKKGEIKNWDMKYSWPSDAVKVVLGAYYVGQIDDLSIFNRGLSEEEVQVLHGLPHGAGELHK